MKKPKLIIPPKRLMTQTNWGDPVMYHYYPVASIVYRQRLKNTYKLLEPYQFENLIEIGYGSGILLPTLSKIAKKVTALDLHKETDAVKRMLDWYQVSNVELISGDIMAMPFADALFDACVIVSTLEDIHESERAAREIARIVKPGGLVVISFPVKNIITDSFFKLVGEDPEDIHPSDHNYILGFLGKQFTIEKRLLLPSFVPLNLSLYVSVRMRNTPPKV
ncbi:MAG: class I SAM-dependent methyltransferase [Patescibacteria group bacterium]